MSQNNYYDLPNNIRIAFNIFYSVVMCIGMLGNMMVIMVILKIKNMRNSTNIFLANLAIADLMVLLVWSIEELVDVNSGRVTLIHTDILCKTVPIIKVILLNVSVLTILAIGVERYYAICQPLKAGYICTKSRAYKMCLLAWTLAALFSSPNILIHRYQQDEYVHVWKGTFMLKEAMCRTSFNPFWEATYIITSVSVFFCLPLIILWLLYWKIARHLNNAVTSSINAAAIRHSQHVVRMLATVVVAFVICHVPIRFLKLVYLLIPGQSLVKLGAKEIIMVSIFSKFLLVLHSLINPILYNLMSQKFRAGFKIVCSDIVLGFIKSKCRWFWRRKYVSVPTEVRNTTSV